MGQSICSAQVETREERMAKRQKEMEGTWFCVWHVEKWQGEIEAVLVVLDGFHQLLSFSWQRRGLQEALSILESGATV